MADHGGLRKILELYTLAGQLNNWVTAFESIYDMSLEAFEAKAGRYIAGIRAVEG